MNNRPHHGDPLVQERLDAEAVIDGHMPARPVGRHVRRDLEDQYAEAVDRKAEAFVAEHELGEHLEAGTVDPTNPGPVVDRRRRVMDVLLELREKGNTRRDRWHAPNTEPWTGADWGNAMGGECGEAQNVVKKLRRIETGTGSQDGLLKTELVAMLALELADTIAYADLLAQHYGIDLRRAIAEKFNAVSEREGFPERIEVPS